MRGGEVHPKDAPTCLPLWAPSSQIDGEEHPFAAPDLPCPSLLGALVGTVTSHPQALQPCCALEGAGYPGVPQQCRQCWGALDPVASPRGPIEEHDRRIVHQLQGDGQALALAP